MKRLVGILVATMSIAALGLSPGNVPSVLPLRPNAAPATQPEHIQERGTPERPSRFVTGITTASMTVYPADPQLANGTAVVILPGGGYGGLSMDSEGHDVARWLNTLGVSAVVLKYRMPRIAETGTSEPLPQQDAHEALRLMRAKAKDGSWPINPARIGILGFSAGGHLAASAAVHFSPENRPDFAILGYPVISMHEGITHAGSRNALLGEKPDSKMETYYSNEERVTPQTPPTFLFHSRDDGVVPIKNSELFAAACKTAGVPVELREYEKGGHGYGLGHDECGQWPAQCAVWMKGLGLLSKP